MSSDNSRNDSARSLATETRGKLTKQKTPAPKFLRAAQGCAVLASLGVGFSSFWGLRDFFVDHSGLIGWLLPLSLAVVVTVLVAVIWHILLEEAANA